jgi:coatomer subunit beta
LDGQFFIAGVLGGTLTKLAIRYLNQEKDPSSCNAFVAEAMLIMASILHFGRSSLPKKPITDDDVERICTCLRVLSERNQFMNSVIGDRSRQVLETMLSSRRTQDKMKEVWLMWGGVGSS